MSKSYNPLVDEVPVGRHGNEEPNYGVGADGSGHTDEDISTILGNNVKFDDEYGTRDQLQESRSNYYEWLLTQNQREYDQAWRDNERQYTSAAAQLQRLMETGLSRSAALALLQGAGDAGSGSGQQAMQVQMGKSPSDTRTNEINNILNPINTALGAVSTGLNLASFGMSVPRMLASNSMAQTSALMSSKTLQGINAASQFMGALQPFVSTAGDALQSSQGLLDYASGLDYFKQNPQLLQGVTSDYFGRQAYNQMYDNMYSSELKNTPEILEQRTKSLMLDNAVKSMNLIHTQAQMDEIHEHVNLLRAQVNSEIKDQQLTDAQIGYTNAGTTLLGQQAGLVAQQKEYVKGQTDLVAAQTEHQRNQNLLEHPAVKAAMQEDANITTMLVQKWQVACAKWQTMTDNKELLKETVLYDLKNDLMDSQHANASLQFLMALDDRYVVKDENGQISTKVWSDDIQRQAFLVDGLGVRNIIQSAITDYETEVLGQTTSYQDIQWSDPTIWQKIFSTK